MKKLFWLLALVLTMSCSEDEEGPVAPSSWSIRYEVTGTAQSVSTTYQNADGGTSQESDVSVPWSYDFRAGKGAFLYISAQNQGSSGTVTTTIYVDDSVWKTSTSSGAYVIATASGIL